MNILLIVLVVQACIVAYLLGYLNDVKQELKELKEHYDKKYNF